MPTKRKEYDITKNPAYITGMRMMEQKKAVQKQADMQAKAATNNPKLNPSGKAVYKGNVTNLGYPEIRPLPDPSASARGANVRSNKARGTQSSAVRAPVK